MEDIKILEEYLDKQDRKFVSEHRLMFLQAVENLIARYKELEKQLNLEIEGRSLLLTSLENNYIPKSKVKEKIEELNDVNSKFSQRVIKSKEFYLPELVQNILQELLED